MITQQHQQQQQQQQQQEQKQEQEQQSQQEGAPTDDPTAPRVSTKGSCSTAYHTDYNIQYEFLVDEDPACVVALGRQIVYHPEKQPIAQPVNEAREESEDHDVISILTSRLNKLRKGPVEMLWELRTFGLEFHVPLYMDTVIVETSQASVYGFLQPQTIQPSGNTLDSKKSYIQTWMTESNREIYSASYIDAGHWQLMVIIPKKAQVVWFCSLHSKIKAEFKSLIQTVMTRTRGQQLEVIYSKSGETTTVIFAHRQRFPNQGISRRGKKSTTFGGANRGIKGTLCLGSGTEAVCPPLLPQL
ncbi:hypothetical protein LR48_Vigan11g051800 [Vigna angularis]|uniref:Ubiquitin-like protease family profile domain-containing protein n=1 Tax=Phaseolus angularis TaxID=3914 RepID=A0A0L9VR05_PHAAN|nr:hypothetical protein LR48_Vigan11g051800 [Vigna angularis]